MPADWLTYPFPLTPIRAYLVFISTNSDMIISVSQNTCHALVQNYFNLLLRFLVTFYFLALPIYVKEIQIFPLWMLVADTDFRYLKSIDAVASRPKKGYCHPNFDVSARLRVWLLTLVWKTTFYMFQNILCIGEQYEFQGEYKRIKVLVLIEADLLVNFIILLSISL